MADNNNKAKDIVHATHNCFKELCKTLESQQARVKELSNRRLLLAQEVSVLRKEVENVQSSGKKDMPKEKGEKISVVATSDGPTCHILNNKGVQTDVALENRTAPKASKTKVVIINEGEVQKEEEKLQRDLKVNLSTMKADVTTLLDAVVKASGPTTTKTVVTSLLNTVVKKTESTISVENK